MTLRRDGELHVIWHVDERVFAEQRRCHPDATPCLKVVGLRPSWDGGEHQELELPLTAGAGSQALPALRDVRWVRAALGLGRGPSFRPLVVGIEASAEGITYRPYGVSVEFAQTAVDRAKTLTLSR